jgi:general secretion pathway protein J
MTRNGFTLVEMLAALFVFGLLTAAGSLVVTSTLNGQAAVHARMDRLGALQRSRAMLKADLGQIAVRPTRDRSGVRGAVFTGRQPDGERPFIALARRGWENPDGRPRASVQYVEYRLVEGRLERLTRAALDGAPVGEPQIMLEGVERLEVAYMNRGAWSRTWLPTPGIDYPQAVRLHAVVRDLGGFDQLIATPGGLR